MTIQSKERVTIWAAPWLPPSLLRRSVGLPLSSAWAVAASPCSLLPAPRRESRCFRLRSGSRRSAFPARSLFWVLVLVARYARSHSATLRASPSAPLRKPRAPQRSRGRAVAATAAFLFLGYRTDFGRAVAAAPRPSWFRLCLSALPRGLYVMRRLVAALTVGRLLSRQSGARRALQFAAPPPSVGAPLAPRSGCALAPSHGGSGFGRVVFSAARSVVI